MGKAEELAQRLRDLHLATTYDEALQRAKEMIGDEAEGETLNEVMGEEVSEVKKEDEELKKELEEIKKAVEHLKNDVKEIEELRK